MVVLLTLRRIVILQTPKLRNSARKSSVPNYLYEESRQWFYNEKENQEMIHDAVASGMRNPQELKMYEEGIKGNIDKEVDEWTSTNQL